MIRVGVHLSLHRAGYGTASLFGAPHIFYPNANLFDSRHIPFAMGTCQHHPALLHYIRSSNPSVALLITAPLGNKHVRVYREYEYQSIYTPPHEIVHALQTLISDSQVCGKLQWRAWACWRMWPASSPSCTLMVSPRKPCLASTRRLSGAIRRFVHSRLRRALRVLLQLIARVALHAGVGGCQGRLPPVEGLGRQD